jgi:hypothetical protein
MDFFPFKNEEFKEYCSIMNKIFEYNNYEKQNWGSFIREITKD